MAGLYENDVSICVTVNLNSNSFWYCDFLMKIVKKFKQKVRLLSISSNCFFVGCFFPPLNTPSWYIIRYYGIGRASYDVCLYWRYESTAKTTACIQCWILNCWNKWERCSHWTENENEIAHNMRTNIITLIVTFLWCASYSLWKRGLNVYVLVCVLLGEYIVRERVSGRNWECKSDTTRVHLLCNNILRNCIITDYEEVEESKSRWCFLLSNFTSVVVIRGAK